MKVWQSAPSDVRHAYHAFANRMMVLRAVQRRAERVTAELYEVVSELHNADALRGLMRH